MITNYLKVAWRNLQKNKLYSFINIAGLATGMAVSLLIGLWIHDELSFDKTNTANYDHIGRVWQNVNFGDGIATYNIMPIPLAKDMRTNYPDFQYVTMASALQQQSLAYGDKLISHSGVYTEPYFPVMMTLKMLSGDRNALKDMNTVLLSSSLATALFGIAMPAAWYVMNKWLLNYEIHTGIPWWIFVASGSTALLLTLITVSFQAIRAGLSNPVTSLRSE